MRRLWGIGTVIATYRTLTLLQGDAGLGNSRAQFSGRLATYFEVCPADRLS